MYFLSYWIKATRPKTLIASLIPVLVGASNYLGNNEINQVSISVVCGCLIFIFLIQISTNLANDFFDSKTGADLTAKMLLKGLFPPVKLKEGRL